VKKFVAIAALALAAALVLPGTAAITSVSASNGDLRVSTTPTTLKPADEAYA
jgi:hypothetical protein